MPELPGSLAALLSLLRPGFTAPSFSTFCWLVSGFTARIGDRTVTGMWQAVGLAGELHHSRAHDFFARARWRPDRLGLLLGDFVIATLLPAGTPLRLVIDDTLFGRSGGKVFGAQLHYDNAAPAGAGRRVRLGNCWVVVGPLVELPFMAGRPLCLPILFRLYRSGSARPSRVALAVELLELMAARYRTRQIELVADGAYAARGLARELPARATLTTRMRKDAALYELAPSPTGKPGRPRAKGQRLPSLTQMATDPATRWKPVELVRQGKAASVPCHSFTCLWYEVFGQTPVRVVIVRTPGQTDGFDIALLSTDAHAAPGEIIARYAARWAIEVCFFDAKQTVGVGETRNRVESAVLRTVPFGFLCQALAITWYALAGQAERDVARRRRTAPCYRHKRAPSHIDMLAVLRREIIRAQFHPGHPPRPTPQQFTPAVQRPLRQVA